MQEEIEAAKQEMEEKKMPELRQKGSIQTKLNYVQLYGELKLKRLRIGL